MKYKRGDVVIYRTDKFVSIDVENNEEICEKNKVGLIVGEYISGMNGNDFYWVYVDGSETLMCSDWLDRICKISNCVQNN
jgi:hypothetical protein